MNKHLNIFIFFFVFVSFAIADDFSFSGYGSTGYISYNRSIIKGNKEETFYNAKLQMAIELTKKIETQLDFRAESDEHAVELREFSVKFEYYDYMKFKFGNIKLPFGYEQLMKREDLVTFDRSLGHESYSELGFGGRSVGFLAYYNYSDKRKDFPYSYYLNLFRNNNLTTGAVLRGAYHYADFIFGGSFLMQYRGGGDAISSTAAGADITLETKNTFVSVEGTFFKDPVVSMQNTFFNDELAQQAGPHDYRDEEIYGATVRFTAAYKFSTEADVIKDIEPLYMFSAYFPDISETGDIRMQNMMGANFYFSKQVRMRLQVDYRLTKTEFSNKYDDLGTRGILDLQIRF